MRIIHNDCLPEGKRRAPGGFTLIETLIVVVIVILLAGIGVPSLGRLVASSRLQEVAWLMVEDLRTTKESAILYQQDLNVYLDFGNSPIEPTNANNKNNRRYFYETFQYDPLTDPVSHYVPTDAPDGKFVERVLKYGIVVDAISGLPNSSITFDGKKYFVITFRSGAGNTFRGRADVTTSISSRTNTSTSAISSDNLTVRLKDTQGHLFYVIINVSGKITMNGSPP